MHEKDPDADRIAQHPALTCQAIEDLLCELWSVRFGRRVSPHEDFFDAGGDSVALIEMVAEAQDRGLPLRSSAAFRHTTAARLAEHLALPCDSAESAQWADRASPLEAEAFDGDADGALFFVGSDRYAEAEREVLPTWARGRPVRRLTLPGPIGRPSRVATVAELAEPLLDLVRVRQPVGPYRLAGFDIGAPFAFELARRLRELGADVALLALVAPPVPPSEVDPAAWEAQTGLVAGRFALTGGEDLTEIHARMRAAGWLDEAVLPEDLPRLHRTRAMLAHAVFEYKYSKYDGPGLLLADGADPHPAESAWASAPGLLNVHRLDFKIESTLPVLRAAHVAEAMRKALDS